jgi:GGDEF domain-containing protein
MEYNPEMNDNQIAGLIYAEITGRGQNTTQNNQGSRSQDQGAQGETGRAERTGQPAESRTDQETGQREQQLNQEVAGDRAGQPATESNDGQGDQPASDGVVQPEGTGTDTVGTGQEVGATGGTTDPAVTQEEQPSLTQDDPNVRQAPEPLDLTAEQDGTTTQATDPNAETRAQVNRERDFFGLDTPEGNTSNVGMGGRQDDMVGVTAEETTETATENTVSDSNTTESDTQTDLSPTDEQQPARRDDTQRDIYQDRIDDIDDPVELRAYVNDLRADVMTDERTGLGSNRAWIQREPKAYTASVDLDSLKWVNDNLGHAVGDRMIELAGEALVRAGFKGDAFHVSGDEFYVQANSAKKLNAGLKIARDWLGNQTVGDGDNAVSPGFSYGIGQDLTTAEQELSNDKARREETGERAARGERPGVAVGGRGQDRGPGEAETDGQATAQDRQGEGAERSEPGQQNTATNEFVTAPDGSLDFGDIAEQVASVIGRQPGKIKLQKGEHRGNHLGFGLAHIEIEHPEIQDAVEFVSGVASSYDSIYKSPRGRLRIVKAGSPDELLVVELRPHKDGDFYSVVSAYKSRKVEGDLLWGAAQSLPSGPGGQSALSETENLRETGETRPSAKQTADESIAQPQNIDQAANEAATSSTNDTLAPTDEQKAAGNYKKGHFSWNGFNITIENPKDSTRSGTDDNGNAWSNTMQAHYGYLKRTEGADGEHVDVFFGQNEVSEKVYVIDQRRDKGNRGPFDEHKIMIGFKNKMDAINAYKGSYQKGWGVGNVSTLTTDELKSWLAEGDLKKPYSGQPEKTADNKTTKGTSFADTEDVGGEMSFNRRQKGFSLQDIQDASNDTERVAMAVKAKVWQRPDYQELVDSGVKPIMVHLVKQIYDSIPTKPKHTADKYIYGYVEGVEAAREAVNEFLADKKAQVDMTLAAAKLVSGYQESFSSTVDISSLSSRDTTGALSWFMERLFPKNEKGKRWGSENEAGNIRGNAMGNKFISQIQIGISDLRKAVEAVSDGFPAKQEAWQRSYEIVEKDGSFGIKGKNRYRILESFDTREEAVTRAREMTSRKKKDAFKEPATSPQHSTRHGVDRRDGKNVSTAEMKEAFGFSKINFGNWMKGKSGDKERQAHINSAYDAFYDLSEIIGLPPKAMSLNGTLSIAFGAQGKGGRAAAHFVPGLNEINLTRNTGAGSLAHEWAHALDHYFGVQAGMAKKNDPFLSTFPFVTGGESEIRPEVVEAFAAIDRAMNKKTTTQTPEEVENLRQLQVDRSKRYLDSWLKGLIEEVKSKEINDSVVAFGKAIERLESGDVGGKVKLGKSRFYVNEATNELREAYKGVTGQYFEMNRAQQISLNAESLSVVIDAEKFAENHDPQQVVSTDYKRNAKSKESASGKPYWSTPPEMLARAFEVYVVDKLAEKEARNDYLTAAWKNVSSEADAAELDMAAQEALIRHPSGEERQTINLAFDVLMDTIETKETESGVALFRVTPNTRGGVRLQDAIRKVRSITSEWTVFADRSSHVVATFADLPADVQKAARDGGGDEKVKGVFHYQTPFSWPALQALRPL